MPSKTWLSIQAQNIGTNEMTYTYRYSHRFFARHQLFVLFVIIFPIFLGITAILTGVFAIPAVVASLALAPALIMGLPLWAFVASVGLAATALATVIHLLICMLLNRKPLESFEARALSFSPSDDAMRLLFPQERWQQPINTNSPESAPLSKLDFLSQFKRDRQLFTEHLQSERSDDLKTLINRYIKSAKSTKSKAAQAKFHHFIVRQLLEPIFKGELKTSVACLTVLLKCCFALARPIDSIDKPQLWNLQLGYDITQDNCLPTVCLQDVFAQLMILYVENENYVTRDALKMVLATYFSHFRNDQTPFSLKVTQLLNDAGKNDQTYQDKLKVFVAEMNDQISLILLPGPTLNKRFTEKLPELIRKLDNGGVKAVRVIIEDFRKQLSRYNTNEGRASLAKLIRDLMSHYLLKVDDVHWNDDSKACFNFLLQSYIGLANNDNNSSLSSLIPVYQNHVSNDFGSCHGVNRIKLTTQQVYKVLAVFLADNIAAPTSRLRFFLERLIEHGMDEQTFSAFCSHMQNNVMRYSASFDHGTDQVNDRITRCLKVLEDKVRSPESTNSVNSYSK